MNQSAINTTPKPFDLMFVGLGAANCLLILQLYDSDLLIDKTIAIIEPESKSTNDRTFCFWATEEELLKLNIKKLVSYSWDFVEIMGIAKQQIKPLHYFHVKGIDLYEAAKNILRENDVSFFKSFLKENPIIESNYHEIRLENETLYANKIFDSRQPSFLKPQKNQCNLYQSFYGWIIKTSFKTFDKSTIVMMDFNVPQNNFTQFIYLLPFDEDSALIEITRFGEEKILEEDARLILNDYLNKLNISFDILEHEQGVIPMNSAKIKIDNLGNNWVNMGARADLLKCSTGYAFHAMAEDALIQMEAIRNNQLPKRKLRKQRFIFYDRLLLKILKDEPKYGKIIFETLFNNVPITKVLSFLREKTSISEEIFIFSKLPKRLFIKTALKDLMQQVAIFPILIMPFLFTIVTLILSHHNYEPISWVILATGFLSVGLSHGALDHLISKKITNKKQLLLFVVSYLLKSALLGLVWLFLPDIALIIFIAYSAWHFGQADFKEWNLKQGGQSFLWGLIVLMTILFFHFEELNWIVKQIPNLLCVTILKEMSESQITSIKILIITCGIFLSAFNKSKFIIYTLTYLLLSSFLPLLLSFGIYFVGQHSFHGWRHLSIGLNESSSKLFLKSLPFSIGGALIILFFMLFSHTNQIGIFFVILSCLSIPHVLYMHRFYSLLK